MSIRVVKLSLFMYPLVTALLTGCLSNCTDDPLNPPRTKFNILWETGGYGIDGNYDGRIADGVLYQPERYFRGMSATRLSDGKVLWEIEESFVPASNPVIVGDRVYIRSRDEPSRDDPGYILIMDKSTGREIGRMLPSVVSLKDSVFMNEWWLEEHDGELYFSVYSETATGSNGIYRVNPAAVGSNEGTPAAIDAELFLSFTKYQRASVRPVFDGDTVYVYLGGSGWRGPLPPGEAMVDGYYPQEAVRLCALDLGGTLEWSTGFTYAGRVGGCSSSLKISGNLLLLADWTGSAGVMKDGGRIVFEKSGELGSYHTVADGARFYTVCSRDLNCFSSDSGELLWKHSWKFTRDGNPVVRGNRLYLVDAEALWVFDKVSGRIIGYDRGLGIPGDRSQGYVPVDGDIMYIPMTEKVAAVKLGSER